MTIIFHIKEYSHLVKMTQDIAILPLAHKQPLFGTQKKHVAHFKLLSRKNDTISPEIFFESIPFEKFEYDRFR